MQRAVRAACQPRSPLTKKGVSNPRPQWGTVRCSRTRAHWRQAPLPGWDLLAHPQEGRHEPHQRHIFDPARRRGRTRKAFMCISHLRYPTSRGFPSTTPLTGDSRGATLSNHPAWIHSRRRHWLCPCSSDARAENKSASIYCMASIYRLLTSCWARSRAGQRRSSA